MNLFIATVDKILFEGPIRHVICPGSEGELTVLPGHAPLITALKKGAIRVAAKDGGVEEFEIDRGILEVTPSQTIILL